MEGDYCKTGFTEYLRFLDVTDYNFAVGLTPQGHQGNLLTENSIHSNGRLGINLVPPPGGADGVTPNDSCDVDEGGNLIQNYPELSSAETDGIDTIIEGELNSSPNTLFDIEFFTSPTEDPTGFGEGHTFVGSVQVMTDASCVVSFSFATPVPVAPGSAVTATATDPGGNTSEFSRAVPAVGVFLDISVDIEPGIFPNRVNLKRLHGQIWVAILTTDDFDASDVDPAAVRFGPSGREARPSHNLLEDVDQDGDMDLLVRFRVRESQIGCRTGSALITGMTLDGQPIFGRDSIRPFGGRCESPAPASPVHRR